MKAMWRRICASGLVAVGAARAEFPWDGQRVEVASTVFDAAAFREEKQELTLWFDNGAVYVYREVPSSVYSRFLEAPGKGAFFHRHIRGRFAGECRQVAHKKSVTAPAVSSPIAPPPTLCQRASKGGGT